jgi:hypothetical protein
MKSPLHQLIEAVESIEGDPRSVKLECSPKFARRLIKHCQGKVPILRIGDCFSIGGSGPMIEINRSLKGNSFVSREGVPLEVTHIKL